MSYECLYRATIGLIENERGSLDRVPSIVRRASSATPVPVVFLPSFSCFRAYVSLSRVPVSLVALGKAVVVLSRCCSSRFRLKGRFSLLFLSVKFLFQAPFLVNGLIIEGAAS